MRTSPELLKDILGVLGQISSKIDSINSSSSTRGAGDSSKKSMMGFNLSEFAQNKSTNEKIKDTASSIKALSYALGPLSGGILKFALIPRMFKRSLADFLKEILTMSRIFGKPASSAAKEIAEAINIFSESLPKLSKGILKFGILQKTGLVSAARLGILSLISALAMAGNPATMPLVLAGAAALSSIGVALSGIANVLKSISLVMLSFSASVVLMVGTIFLASTLFKVGPLAAMGIVVGSIAMLAGGFALMGILSPLIIRSGKAVTHMGLGMMSIAGGILALGGVFKLLDMMNIDVNAIMPSFAKSLALLGLTFAGLGVFSLLIIPGTLALIAMGTSLGIFSLISLSIGAVISKLGGKKGVNDVTDNIGLLVGGTLRGVIKGISSGLLGEEGNRPSSFFGKIGKVVGNVGILIGSIGLLMGVSFALISFAFALKAFTKAGTIKTITGYKTNGEPIFGESVNVVYAGENIAKSIGSFFTTLTKTFKNPAIIPNKKDTENIVDILMGNKGFKILGIRLVGSKKPGVIDALTSFAKLISIFAKTKQMPIYEIDSKGETKIKEYTDPVKIAGNIVETLKSFFKAFKDKQSELDNLSTTTSTNIAQVLLGRQAPRILGFKIPFTKDKPGILEPILKFTEVLTQYAKLGKDNKLPTEFDENGKIINYISVNEIAVNMVKGISSFLGAFNTEFSKPGVIKGIENQSEKMNSALTNFSSVITKFDTLSKSISGIDKLSSSIGTLANNIGLLVENTGSLNTENLEKLSNVSSRYATKTQGSSIVPLATSTSSPTAKIVEPNWDILAEKIGQVIAEKLSGINTGEFQFRFMDSDVGQLTIKR